MYMYQPRRHLSQKHIRNNVCFVPAIAMVCCCARSTHELNRRDSKSLFVEERRLAAKILRPIGGGGVSTGSHPPRIRH